MRQESFDFTGAGGDRLAGLLQLPDAEPLAYALFAHCFTCGKDVRAAAQLARSLAQLGIATLRFDFTGLGASGGDFARTSFTSNVQDLVAAADALRQRHAAPRLLIGHSLGGSAVLAAVHSIPDCVAVATIGAPFDTAHALHLLGDALAEVEREGVATVQIAGRGFKVGRELVQDLASQDQAARIAGLRRALLVMHAPTDAVVGIENASRIFAAARHPKSFVSLDTADHLLSRREDAAYAARVLAAWASHYVPPPAAAATAPAETGGVLVEETGQGRFQHRITVGPHGFLADEPPSFGGAGSGPGPYDLLLAALGACTSMTMRLYAERKDWPLTAISVRLRHAKIHARDCADCETRDDARVDEISKEIALEGPLDATQRERLLEIAARCPVHRTLQSEVKIRSRLREPSLDP
ncbi:MAG: alpha/beta fold hydrolase [Geminicoccaceae bacterium]